ncbi:protein of unknown function [Xenorhabdus nematophila AN6/1]|nr:protein of unknown function [Xenorhabdus nematophila AN6/1]
MSNIFYGESRKKRHFLYCNDSKYDKYGKSLSGYLRYLLAFNFTKNIFCNYFVFMIKTCSFGRLSVELISPKHSKRETFVNIFYSS